MSAPNSSTTVQICHTNKTTIITNFNLLCKQNDCDPNALKIFIENYYLTKCDLQKQNLIMYNIWMTPQILQMIVKYKQQKIEKHK